MGWNCVRIFWSHDLMFFASLCLITSATQIGGFLILLVLFKCWYLFFENSSWSQVSNLLITLVAKLIYGDVPLILLVFQLIDCLNNDFMVLGNFKFFTFYVFVGFVVFSFYDVDIIPLIQTIHLAQTSYRNSFPTLKVIIKILSFFLLHIFKLLFS